MVHVSVARVSALLAIAAFLATSCKSDQPESTGQSGELGADATDCFSLADELVALIEANDSCTLSTDCTGVAAWELICLRPEVETPGDCSLSVGVNADFDHEEYYNRLVPDLSWCIDPSGNWVGRVFDGRACVTGCGLVPDVGCVSGECRIIIDEGTPDGG